MIAHAGKVATALTAGLVSYWLGHLWIFYLVILCALISLTALSFIRPGEINYKVAREIAEDPSTGLSLPPTPLRQLLKRKAILIFNLSFIFYYMSNAAQFAMVAQVLANQDPDHSALLLAGCMLIAECTMIATAFVMGMVVNRFGRKAIFLTAFFILPIRAILYTLTNNPFLLLSIQILDGVAAGIMGVIGTVINSDLAVGTGRFNFLQGLGSLSASIGSSLSNAVAGWIATFFGFNISFIALASIGVIGAMMFKIFMPETKTS
jgi:MFS family permease